MKKVALGLIIVGALNWLSVGLMEWDFVSAIFGGESLRPSSAFSRVIYTLVGLAGLYAISFLIPNRHGVRGMKD